MKRLWIRLYPQILDDPQVQRLSTEAFRFWINCLCLAGLNDGTLPSLEDMAWTLRSSVPEIERMVAELGGLIHRNRGRMEPKNWRKWQYLDQSVERMRRLRDKAVTGGVTVPVTADVTARDGPCDGSGDAHVTDSASVSVSVCSETPIQTLKPLRAREAEKPELSEVIAQAEAKMAGEPTLGEVLELMPTEAEGFDESSELWERFWRAYVATGKPLTIRDRIASENLWKGYPLEEQRRILPHLEVQIQDNWSGAKYTPKPQRYLSAREWDAVAAERVFPTPAKKESYHDRQIREAVEEMERRDKMFGKESRV